LEITVFLKRASSGSTTHTADTVLLRFDGTDLFAELRSEGRTVSPFDSIPAREYGRVEASGEGEFLVVIEDQTGNQREPAQATWLTTDFPMLGDVAFDREPLRRTDSGLSGTVTVVRVAEGRLQVFRY